MKLQFAAKNTVIPQNCHTRKLGGITVFFAVVRLHCKVKCIDQVNTNLEKKCGH